MSPLLIITLWILGIIISIPLMAFVLMLSSKWSKLRDKSYKASIKAVLFILLIDIFLSAIFQLFFGHIKINGIVDKIISYIFFALAFVPVTIKIYKINYKKSLELLAYFAVISLGLAIIIGIIAFIVVVVLDRVLPKTPDLVWSGCYNHCLKFSNFNRSEIVKENKNIYTCYCILDNGDRIKTLQMPVDYNWEGLQQNLSKKLKETRAFSEEDIIQIAPRNINSKFPNMIEDTIWMGKVRVYSIYNSYYAVEIDYEVNVTEIDVRRNKASFNINGQEFNKLDINESTKLADSAELGIINVFEEDGTPMVEFYIGSK